MRVLLYVERAAQSVPPQSRLATADHSRPHWQGETGQPRPKLGTHAQYLDIIRYLQISYLII